MALSIIHYNNNHYLKDYPLDLHMIKAGVKPIPAHIWRYGMEHLTGRLREINDDVLLKNLLPVGKASVTGEGISFSGLNYTCERAIREQWFDRIEGKQRRSIEIVSEATVDHIHIRLDHGRIFETCHLTPTFKRFAGKDWYEMREYFAWQQQQKKGAEAAIQQAAAAFHAQINSLISTETKETEQALKAANLSKRARSNNIRENRNQLKRHERKHGPLSISGTNSLPLPASLDNLTTDTELRRPGSAEGYVPPAKPLDEISAARERARKKNG
jgi:hypothetical protein